MAKIPEYAKLRTLSNPVIQVTAAKSEQKN